MNRLYCTFFAFLFLLFVSCSKDLNNLTEVRFEGEHYINEDIWIDKNEKLIIEPGSTISFGPEGSFQLLGEFEAIADSINRIQLIGSGQSAAQTIIHAYDDVINFIMEGVKIDNGLIVTEAQNNLFEDVHIKNEIQLTSDDAMIRSWFGTFLFENGSIISNGTGEGLLVHNSKMPKVSNCIFNMIPDAVEYISSEDGVISNSFFYNIPDDAVDNNNCHRTHILNNEFYWVSDRAVEIGSDSFGSSTDINIENNLLVECHIGINVKEGSNAMISSTTFYKTRLNIELIGSTSAISLSKSVMSGDHAWVSGEEESEFNYLRLMSDQPIENLSDVFVTDIEFMNHEIFDFKIISSNFPEGENANTMGYQSMQ